MNTETVLSDKFVEFSQKIAQLHESKKKLTAEFKKLLEDHKASIKKIDDEATALASDFENWEKQSTAKTKL